MKAFAADLKTIYNAASEDEEQKARNRVVEKWSAKYPNSMKRWIENWDVVVPIFKFSMDIRKIIYTTNAIESLNSSYRKLNRQRSVFPSDQALLKALYPATFEATKKWTQPNSLRLSRISRTPSCQQPFPHGKNTYAYAIIVKFCFFTVA